MKARGFSYPNVKHARKSYNKKKRKFFNNILQTAEEDRSQNKIRNFFRTIKVTITVQPYMQSYKESRWTNYYGYRR